MLLWVRKLLALSCLLLPISLEAQESKPFVQVIPLQILCTKGGPEEMIMKLNERVNEIPKYMMRLKTQRQESLTMIIMENKNNPSATVLLVNPNLDVTCIFFTADDYLHQSEARDLPAKQIENDQKIEL